MASARHVRSMAFISVEMFWTRWNACNSTLKEPKYRRAEFARRAVVKMLLNDTSN